MIPISQNVLKRTEDFPLEFIEHVLIVSIDETGISLDLSSEGQVIRVDDWSSAFRISEKLKFNYVFLECGEINDNVSYAIKKLVNHQLNSNAVFFLFSGRTNDLRYIQEVYNIGIHEYFESPASLDLIRNKLKNYQRLVSKSRAKNVPEKELHLRIKELENNRYELQESLNYAKSIQQDILPSREDVKVVFDKSFHINIPKNVVSGDFYWFTMKNDKALFSLADCTGHGVPGAMMSMLGANILDYAVNDLDNEDPALILSRVNQRIQEIFRSFHTKNIRRDGMDLALIAYNRKRKRLQFSGAKRPAILIRNGSLLTEIRGDSVTTGRDAQYDYSYSNVLLQLQEGDTLYLFSDGLQDQFGGERNKKFGAKRLKELLLDVQKFDMDKQKEIIEYTVNKWKGNNEQTDDISMFGFKV